MTKKRNGYISLILLAMVPFICFVTTLSSTLAWYAYNTRSGLDFNGTTVETAEQLQIGIRTDLHMEQYNLTTENGIAWSAPGNGLSADALNYYLIQNGYASSMVTPVTSAEYEENDELKLFKAPNDQIPGQVEESVKSNYVRIPFCFRVLNLSTGAAIGNRPVWITRSILTCQGEDLDKTIRMHFATSEGGFIFNPTAESKGKLRVAGPLDLSNDGYYDTYNGKEIMYGYYNGEPTYTYCPEDTDLDDVNHTGMSQGFAFLAKHKRDTYKIDNVDAVATKFANYLSKDEVMPTNIDGRFSGGKPIAITSQDSGIGESAMTLWVEGWDFTCVDKVIGLAFSLSLTFQINSL